MGVEKKDEPDSNADLNPLAPGVWVTETTGFASVPPRAQSDLCDVRSESDKKEEEAEPRIERYPER